MNILFTEIDGIITTEQSSEDIFSANIKPELISNLNKYIISTNSFVVLNTKWTDIYELQKVGDFLYEKGILGNCILSATPSGFASKTEAVIFWLNHHMKDVKNFVIIGHAESQQIKKTILKEKFVQIDPKMGFTEEISTKTIFAFNK